MVLRCSRDGILPVFLCYATQWSFWKPFSRKSHRCPTCLKQFARPALLRVHSRVHTGERPYSCDRCQLAFAAKENLRKHQRRHTGEKPFTCRLCEKGFSRTDNLAKHLRLRHRLAEDSQLPDRLVHRQEITVSTLTPSQRRIQSDSIMASVPAGGAGEEEEQGCRHSCGACGKSFSSRAQLRTHRLVHSGDRPHQVKTTEKISWQPWHIYVWKHCSFFSALLCDDLAGVFMF